MDEETPKHSDGFVDEDIDRRLDTAPAEQSLSEALNGLEQILEHRRRGKPESTPATAEPPATPHADAQYTIPLLHDVVVPGGEEASVPSGEPGDRRLLQPEIEEEEEELHRKLSERLANEIEVIVQARIETAVQEAAEDIREQVRNHLEIMLPEILEELNVLGRRLDD
jgi:hypothetical protein